jgi:hypothetical protein
VMSARAALRALPALSSEISKPPVPVPGATILLPAFRALAICLCAARFPSRGSELRSIASTSANGVAHATSITSDAKRYMQAARAKYSYDRTAGAAAALDSSGHAVRSVRAAFASNATDSRPAAAHAARAIAASGVFLQHAGSFVGLDAQKLANGVSPRDLAKMPLWDAVYAPVDKNWKVMRENLLSASELWGVWIDWYEAVASGWPADEELEIARCKIPDELWKHAGQLNNYIENLLIQHDYKREKNSHSVADLESVPSQGAGPHFQANDDGVIERVRAEEIDASGNNLSVISQLKPMVLNSASSLQSLLSKNEFPELAEAVEKYRSALAPQDVAYIEWGVVWGSGVILQNAANAAERSIQSRTLPELEDPAKAALDSLLQLHGPMILASREGAELSAASRAFAMTNDQQKELRENAQIIAKNLEASPDIVTKSAAEFVSEAANAIGSGPNPERGSIYGLATLKNVSIVIVGGAAAATPTILGSFLGAPFVGAVLGAPLSLVIVEAVKKSPAFSSLVTQLGAKLDRMTDLELQEWMQERVRRLAPFGSFVRKNKTELRCIAQSTPELKWMLKYIDYIDGEV